MYVLLGMAVNAVHPSFHMDILQMNPLLKSLRIVEGYLIIVCIQQITFPISFIHLPEVPTVPMPIRDLNLTVTSVIVVKRCTFGITYEFITPGTGFQDVGGIRFLIPPHSAYVIAQRTVTLMVMTG